MRIRIPSRKIRERFLLIYELEGCQKAVDFLTKYYRVRRMRIILNGRKVGNGDSAVYFKNKAYFTKRGLNKQNVLHELYHHVADIKRLEMSLAKEEREASKFARAVLVKTKPT
jgi:hypothetical protein